MAAALEVSYLYAPHFESTIENYVKSSGYANIKEWEDFVDEAGFEKLSTGVKGRLQRPSPGDILVLPTIGQWTWPWPSHVVVVVAYSTGKGQPLCFEKQGPEKYYQLISCNDITCVEVYRPPLAPIPVNE